MAKQLPMVELPMVELPMVLISEILSRLPVKPLIRFLCVSKSWYSLIKDPLFINLHLKHSLQNHLNQTLIIRDCYHYSLDFPSLNSLTLIDHPLDSGGTGTEIYGSCNGLLCLSNGDVYGVDDTIFYNPFTRRHHVLPASDIEFPPGDDMFNGCDRIVYGFGFDCVNDDYKLVRLIQFFGDDEFDSEVKVYSLKSRSWRRIRDFPREYYLTFKRAWGFFVSGCLHWVVTRNPETDGTKLIVAFDLVSEEYKIVSQPEYSEGEFHMTIGVLDACLYVMCNYVGVKSEVWVMKEYGVQKSWSKLFSILQGDVIGVFEYVRPLGCVKDGSRVLVEKDGKSLFWLDLGSGEVENVVIAGLPALYDTEMIVESLVPLERNERKVKPEKKKKKKVQQPKQKKKTSKPKRDDDDDDDMSGFLAKGFKLKL